MVALHVAADRADIAAVVALEPYANAADAVRTAQLGREAGLSHWVKLEVIGDEATLFPDTAALVDVGRQVGTLSDLLTSTYFQ